MAARTTASPTPFDRAAGTRRLALWCGLSVAAVAIIISVWGYTHRERGIFAAHRRALVNAVGAERLVEARLTGGFAYGPRRSVTRSETTPPGNLSLLAAAGALQKQVEADPNAANLWSFGVAQLLLGRHDQAIRDLDDALALAPENAQLYSDSASARLARADVHGGDSEDLARAIDATERALSFDSRLIEALFNKALALERAGLTEAAVDAWTAYLASDRTSDWANEARARLGPLRSLTVEGSECLEMRSAASDRLAETVDRCPQEAREHAERLLGEWANATLEGQPDLGTAKLKLVERLAASLATRTGDRLLLDAVGAIQRGGTGRTALARGHNALERGRALYDADRRLEATDYFREARGLLRSGGSEYWLRAQQSLATVHTHRRELTEALALLSEVERIAVAKNYRAVRARTAWLTGVATLQLSDPSRALEHYHKAAGLFNEIGDKGNVSNLMNAAADSERILGDFARGWQSLSTALRHLNSVGDPTRRYLAYYNAALFSHREGLEFAALHYQQRALAIARARKGPAGIIEASINHAGILGRLGRIAEAESSLTESTGMLSLLEDAQPRAYMTARIAATRGEFLVVRNPEQSIRELDAALQHFARVEPSETPRLLLMKGLALASGGDEPRAVQAYLEGIRNFEARLRRLQVDRQRVSYSDEGWELYRRLVQQKVKDNQLDEALALSDRGRSRAGAGIGTPLSVERVRSQLGPDQVLVYYAALENELYAWVITGSSIQHRRMDIAASDLQSRASLISRTIVSRGSAAVLDAALRSVHDAVVAPLALPSSAREVIFVPDGPLRMVPFAALRDAAGQFLVQRAAIVVKSSLSGGEPNTSMAAPAMSRSEPEVLVIGEPVTDPVRWPQMAPLPSAGREAAAVARLYGRSTLLARGAATKAQLLARLPSADIFHFAGHAVANEDFPELSTLILTATPSENGELMARDLDRSRLRAGSTVVLSACQTGFGPIRRAAGIQSLAQAFLSMGAGSVIAASWDVEDFDTSELMAAFHEHLSRGRSPAQSLRSAQMALIDAGKPVSSWAGFTVFGGARSGTINTQTRRTSGQH
jgi:CHAT domain-containing protein